MLQDGSDVTGFGSFDNSTCNRVLDLLELGDLRLREVVIQTAAVVKLGVNNGSRNGGSCCGTDVWMDTAKLTNIVIAGFGDRWDLVRKGEVFIEYEAEASSGLIVLSEELWILASCLLRPTSKNSVHRGVQWHQRTQSLFNVCVQWENYYYYHWHK